MFDSKSIPGRCLMEDIAWMCRDSVAETRIFGCSSVDRLQCRDLRSSVHGVGI